MGFTLWAILGSGLFLMTVWGLVRRKTILNRKAMAAFKDYRIKP